MTQTVATDRQGAVVELTMDAEGRPTCIDIGMCDALLAAFAAVSPTRGDRVVVLKSTGSVFSAGGDLFAIEESLEKADLLLAPLIDRFHSVILAIRALPLPVIASVHGAAAGAGFSLAMACDFVVASRSARWVAGYPKIGTSSDGGLTFQLARRLGASRALEVFLLNDALDAQVAFDMGLVQRVVDGDALDNETLSMAHQLAAQPAAAVREIKSLVSAVVDDGLSQHLDREKAAFLRCAATEDFRNLVKQFTSRATKKDGR